MKNLGWIVCSALILCGAQLSAQFAQNALGLRFSGDDDEYASVGTAVSYQRALGGSRRAEVNLGFRDSRHTDVIKLTSIYQWVWNIQGGLNWYAGPAIGAGVVDYDARGPWRHDPDWPPNDTGLLLSVGGDIGIEYIIDLIPLQIALDLRPEIFVLDAFYDDNFDLDVGLALRWQFP